ncbi:hypothetical protein DYB32_008172 [Aphanomyces invadans]|uniref:RGS domain-containing protein n=1 Tax=Aphanomyces invadans TaxID=157072 RepID=A0A418ALP4_9STRA|nr:hypothetical protein DYB32_008172 [Aphanomyces invadans]
MRESFQSVLSNEIKLRYFKSYCVENMTLENLMFHLDVEDAKRLPNQSFVQARSKKIIDTYIRDGAKMHIHLSPEIHDGLVQNLDRNEIDPAMFVDAQYVAMECIKTEVWPRLIQKAMELPTNLMANTAKAHTIHHDTALVLLQDKIGHRMFKKFLKVRGKDHFVSFIDDVEEYTNLPGIEYMQHTAKKLFKKYLSDHARLQVDMSTKMRQDIEEKLDMPTMDMFKPAIVKVKTGLLQDSLLRYLSSPIHEELHNDAEIPQLVREMTAARNSGKLELPHLDSVLGHPKYMSNFKKYLTSQHAVENLIFLEEVEEFRRLPSSQIVLRNAKKIVDKYINQATARAPLPLGKALHDSMVKTADGMEKSFFSGAVHDIMHVLRQDEVPEFLDAPLFMVLVGAWASLDETYARKQLVGDFELAYFRHRFHAICETKRDRPKS